MAVCLLGPRNVGLAVIAPRSIRELEAGADEANRAELRTCAAPRRIVSRADRSAKIHLSVLSP